MHIETPAATVEKEEKSVEDIKTQLLIGQKPDEETFEKHLNVLLTGGISSKLDSLLFIQEVVLTDQEENKQFVRQNANKLMTTIASLVQQIFDRPRAEMPWKFVQFLLNSLNKLCAARHFLRSVSESNLSTFTEEILNRLLAEDEEKNPDAKESESMVKLFNSVMLRVLENAIANDIYGMLFDLLIKYRRTSSYNKMVGLIIKCILKLTKALEDLMPHLAADKLLLKSHLYLLEFGTDPAKVGDDIGVKTIKTILNELGKHLGERIWDFYKLMQTQNSTPDNYLHRWISMVLKPNQSNINQVPNLQNSSQQQNGGPAIPSQLPPNGAQLPPQQPVAKLPYRPVPQGQTMGIPNYGQPSQGANPMNQGSFISSSPNNAVQMTPTLGNPPGPSQLVANSPQVSKILPQLGQGNSFMQQPPFNSNPGLPPTQLPYRPQQQPPQPAMGNENSDTNDPQGPGAPQRLLQALPTQSQQRSYQPNYQQKFQSYNNQLQPGNGTPQGNSLNQSFQGAAQGINPQLLPRAGPTQAPQQGFPVPSSQQPGGLSTLGTDAQQPRLQAANISVAGSADDFQNKFNTLKMRVGMVGKGSTLSNPPGSSSGENQQAMVTVSPISAPPKNVLNANTSTINTNPTGNGQGGQPIITEMLFQKLNEMKMKMQTAVSTNPQPSGNMNQ